VSFIRHITPHMLGMADAGEKVRFRGAGGYPQQLYDALEEFDVGEELTVRDVRIDDWESTYRFKGVDGRWNTVMFERVQA
jgi:hypothetical protein